MGTHITFIEKDPAISWDDVLEKREQEFVSRRPVQLSEHERLELERLASMLFDSTALGVEKRDLLSGIELTAVEPPVSVLLGRDEIAISMGSGDWSPEDLWEHVLGMARIIERETNLTGYSAEIGRAVLS